MEELLIALVQGLFQIVGEILSNADWFWPTDFAPSSGQPSGDGTAIIGFVYLIIGLAVGWASLHIWHDAVFHKNLIRVLAFFASPPISGGVGQQTASLCSVEKSGRYFWWTFFFSLGLCLVRFGYCHRPI